MTFLIGLHGGIRYLVVAMTVIALVYFVLALVRRTDNARIDRIVMSIWTGLIDSQLVIGLVLIVWLGTSSGTWPRYRLEHAGVMILATVAAHAAVAWRKAGAATRARNNLILIAVVLALIFVGVSVLGSGRWLLGTA